MIIDQLTQTIQLKIVYFGPALSGKTTSLKALFNHFGKKDQVESIESSVRRTLFFDFGTISFQNQKWLLKIHVYSTTGQDFYIVTRPITLSAIDGIIFVADSQKKAYERNLISWNELCSYFEEKIISLPKVIAFNKQDLMDKFPPFQFLHEIDYYEFKSIDFKKTIAINGEGILDSFEEILSLIFKNIYKNQLISVFH
ncbi:MAG: ATP/GTP-binding protein [Promethearchaeota archaeon]